MRLLVFFSGFVVMATELLAGRLLVPTYGDSIIVWGSVIGCFLLTMSIGYWAGGVVADKNAKRTSFFLFSSLLLLALSIVLMYFLAELTFPHPLIAAFSLTAIPGFVGGAIMPLALKHDAHSLKDLGFIAGSLSAFSTVGSVLGTFAIIFAFLPFLGVFKTAVLLVILSIFTIGFLNKWYFLSSLLLLFLLVSPSETGPVDVTIESPYGPVQVYDREGTRHLIINGGQMSEVNMSDRLQDLPYWNYLVCMDRWLEEEESVYIMGLGAGSLTIRAQDKDMDVTAVDINPAVVHAATEYFGLEEDRKTSISVADGRVHLREQEQQFDLITMDVMHYNEHSYEIPPHLITREFFAEAKEKLQDGATMIIHVLTHPEHELARAVASTMGAEFQYVEQMDCQGSQIISASDTPQPNWPETITEELDGGVIITDDKTPIFLQ